MQDKKITADKAAIFLYPISKPGRVRFVTLLSENSFMDFLKTEFNPLCGFFKAETAVWLSEGMRYFPSHSVSHPRPFHSHK